MIWNFRYLALLKVILQGTAGEHSVARGQLRRCQGSRIGDYSFVLLDVAGTPCIDSRQIVIVRFPLNCPTLIGFICLLKD